MCVCVCVCVCEIRSQLSKSKEQMVVEGLPSFVVIFFSSLYFTSLNISRLFQGIRLTIIRHPQFLALFYLDYEPKYSPLPRKEGCITLGTRIT